MSKWLWQSDCWPDFRYDGHALTPALAVARRAQGEIIGLSQALGMAEARNARAQIWVAESLATAAIEGERLDAASVRSSVARRLGLAGAAHASTPAIDGLLDMMEDAASRWGKPLTKRRLCAWQAALFPTGFSGLYKVRAGKLRSKAEPMQIVNGPIHRPKVHFEAPPAERVPAELARFLAWFNGDSAKLDGLLRAGIAHLWFEIIHPFEDGNGRVGRAIIDLALAQDLKADPRVFGLAAELAVQRAAYYEQLRLASRDGADINRWLEWFCRTFAQACGRSVIVVRTALAKAKFWAAHAGKSVSKAQAKTLNSLLDAGPRGFEGGLTTRKYVSLAGVSRATAYRDLVSLVGAGMLASQGQGKRTRYFINLEGWEPGSEGSPPSQASSARH